MVLFGIKGKVRTLKPGRTQVNIISSRKREHSRKPDEIYDIIESCSQGPYLELFARGKRENWFVWGNQSENYLPSWSTYQYNSGNRNGAQLQLLEKQKKYTTRKKIKSSL